MSFHAYKTVSETSMPVSEVEAWLDAFPHKRCENKPNGGIIMSTDSVMFVDGATNKVSEREKRAAQRLAQKEYQKTLREVAKKKKEWAAKEKKKTVNVVSERRKAMIAVLNSGEVIPAIPVGMPDVNPYHEQRRDLVAISDSVNGGIIKVRGILDMQSVYMADNLPRYQGVRFTGKIGGADIAEFTTALNSGLVIEIDSFDSKFKQSSIVIRKVTRDKRLNVRTIFDMDNKVKGWVVLP